VFEGLYLKYLKKFLVVLKQRKNRSGEGLNLTQLSIKLKLGLTGILTLKNLKSYIINT
jgi:hypothetical protein